jgi:A/G-specific adenine glycosylase
MLHRTRADQVVPVYNNFISNYPTVYDITKAKIEDIKTILHPLGLFWRNKLISKMALEIVIKYNGTIPTSLEELESLPGVSQYIAAATRCFAFGYPEPTLDTNTVRIIGRVLGLKINENSRRDPNFKKLYEQIIDKKYPKNFNYAMIDLGSLVCTPKNPKCNLCPFSEFCTLNETKESL